jgi:hypothetical protein
MQAKLIINFDTLSEPVFFNKAELINNSLATNVNFPLPWPSTVPTPTDLNTAFLAYQSTSNAAMTHDVIKTAARDVARTALTVILKKIAPYLEIVANGNTMMLMTTGYDLRQDAVATAPATLPAPPNFSVVRGLLSGVLEASATVVPGAGSYILQQTTGDPSVEANWTGGKVFMHCSDMELTGQVSGTKVSLRLCAVGTNGQGVWTDVVTLYVG